MKTAKATAAPVSEKPILFSGPMVNALLAGTKTQTRRTIKGVPSHWSIPPARFDDGYLNRYGVGRDGESIKCPFGKPGDRLWVRETTERYFLPNLLTGEPTNAECGRYVADASPVLDTHGFDLGWWYSKKTCPPIHMPRWVSRITLEITDVRVERLQDISERDAEAEGARVPAVIYPDSPHEAYSYVENFKLIWESIYGKDSWDENSWLWVLNFSVQLTNDVEASR